jgi:hypothetical protein
MVHRAGTYRELVLEDTLVQDRHSYDDGLAGLLAGGVCQTEKFVYSYTRMLGGRWVGNCGIHVISNRAARCLSEVWKGRSFLLRTLSTRLV